MLRVFALEREFLFKVRPIFMLLTKKQLIGLPVRIESGQRLGEVRDFELDSDLQSIVNYAVKSDRLLNDLFGKRMDALSINRNQVVSLNNKEMVVYDAVIKAHETIPQVAMALKAEEGAGAAMSKM